MLSRLRSFGSRLLRVAFTTQKPTALQPAGKYNEKISKARTVFQLYDLKFGCMEEDNFIAPDATVIGDVTLGFEVAIWGGTVIRGDINQVLYAHPNPASCHRSSSARTACCGRRRRCPADCPPSSASAATSPSSPAALSIPAASATTCKSVPTQSSWKGPSSRMGP